MLKHNYIKIAVFIIIVVVIYYLIRHVSVVEKFNELPAGDPDIQIESFRLIETDAGNKKWEVSAELAKVFNARQKTLLYSIKGLLYGNSGRVTFSADTGVLDMTSRNISLSGGVSLTTEDGTRLESFSLVWIDAEKKLISNSRTRIARKNVTAFSGYFEADMDVERITLSKGVNIRINPTVRKRKRR
ncbi:MAG: LPS export ABC transporter periplasmic protein LptC [Lentisphaerae bacterium GWF2_52_8]|nr:MAG: LPS export ABC transporter periplasmic protein LptC [Lentisphaerae bacterium GWF2_52_8]